jgi:hypothetical protein
VDDATVHHATRAGDPFAHAGQRSEEGPHGCIDGWVYLGFETEEDGEIVEITDRVRCRRCKRERGER